MIYVQCEKVMLQKSPQIYSQFELKAHAVVCDSAAGVQIRTKS